MGEGQERPLWELRLAVSDLYHQYLVVLPVNSEAKAMELMEQTRRGGIQCEPSFVYDKTTGENVTNCARTTWFYFPPHSIMAIECRSMV